MAELRSRRQEHDYVAGHGPLIGTRKGIHINIDELKEKEATWKKPSQKDKVSGLICAKMRSNRLVVHSHNLSLSGLGQCLDPWIA